MTSIETSAKLAHDLERAAFDFASGQAISPSDLADAGFNKAHGLNWYYAGALEAATRAMKDSNA